MKTLKIVAFVLGGVLAVAALLVALAFVPAVQTWAVRKAVAGQPGLSIEVGRVSAGLSSAEVTDVRVVQDGVVVSIGKVEAAYSAWAYVSGKRVDVDFVSVKDLAVDASKALGSSSSGKAPAAAPAQSQPPAPASAFAGVLNLAQLPLDVRLGRLDVNGKALLPDSRSVVFSIDAAGIETGKTGKLSWKVDYADAGGAAPLSAAHDTGSLSVRINGDRKIDLLEMDTVVSLEGPGLPSDRVRITTKAAQPKAGGDESYAVGVYLLRAALEEKLMSADASYKVASRDFSGTWTLAVRSEQFSALLKSLGLPEVAVDGSGRFVFRPDSGDSSTSGKLVAAISDLQKLSPSLAAVGTVKVDTAFDGALSKNVARLDLLNIALASSNNPRLVQIATQQKVSFDLGTKHVLLDNPKADLARISINRLPLAWAQPVAKPISIESGDLSLSLAVMANADGSEIQVRSLEPISLKSVTLSDSGKKLVEMLDLSVAPKIDYSAAKVVATLDPVTVRLGAGDTVDGRLSAVVTNLSAAPTVSFSGKFDERLISVLKPYLPFDIGALAISSSFEGSLEGRDLRLSKFSTTVARDGAGLLASIETLQPLSANLDTVRVSSADPKAPALRARLGEVPLSWAQAYVPNSRFKGSFSGVGVEVTLVSLDELSVRSVSPLGMRGVGVLMDGQSLAEGLDIAADFSASKKGDGVTFDLARAEVRQGKAALVALQAGGEATLAPKFGAEAEGSVEVDVAAAMKQPVLAPFATLSKGNAAAKFKVKYDDRIAAKATLALRNFVASKDGQKFGELDLSLDGSFASDGSGKVTLPVQLVAGGRKSDLSLDASFDRKGSDYRFDAKLTSEQIVVDDFMAFAALAPQSQSAQPSAAATGGTQGKVEQDRKAATASNAKSGSTAQAAVASQVSRDTAAPWKGVSGRFQADMKKVQYGATYLIKAVRCSFAMDDGKVALDSLEGTLNDNPFKVAANLGFDAGQQQPYTLAATVAVNGFDVGAFLKSASPEEKPALETKVSVDAKLDGQGATLPLLAANARGKFDVTGTSGVLRALGKKGGTVSNISKVVGLVGALRGSDTTVAAADLAAELNEMKFDQFSMHVERGADLSLKLTSLEFISPSMRLSGKGSIQHKDGVEIADQPLWVEAQLGGKDHMAVLLGKAYLLGSEKDDKGYSLMSSKFVISGTPAKPDSSALWKIIGEAGLKGAAGAFFR